AGCYDGAKAYRTPFVSGKDSLNNQFTTEDGRTIRIPPTLLISGIAIVPELGRAVTMDAKRAGSALLLVGEMQAGLGGARFAAIDLPARAAGSQPAGEAPLIPRVDLEGGPAAARAVADLIGRGLVLSAHDVSDGGLLCAVAEMLIAAAT